MKLNPIQKMLLSTGMLAIKIPVFHGYGSQENEVAINPVWCDIGSHKVDERDIRYMQDVAVCEGCYEHYN